MKPKITNFTDPKIIAEYSIGTLIRFHLDIPETLRMLGDVNQKKILDLGCGDGQFTQTLKTLGADPVGVDISDEMLAKASNRHADITFIKSIALILKLSCSAAQSLKLFSERIP